MSVGRPVVACDVGGNGEAIVDGETGLLVPPRDPAALDAAMNDLLLDPDRAAAFGRAGRERVEREYAIDRMVDEFANLYSELVDDAAAAPDAGETEAAEAVGTYTRLESGSTPGGPPR